MKEYTITMNFSIESKNADYDKIEIFADELTEIIMDKLTFHDIKIVDISVEDIEDNTEEDYFDHDDEDY